MMYVIENHKVSTLVFHTYMDLLIEYSADLAIEIQWATYPEKTVLLREYMDVLAELLRLQITSHFVGEKCVTSKVIYS